MKATTSICKTNCSMLPCWRTAIIFLIVKEDKATCENDGRHYSIHLRYINEMPRMTCMARCPMDCMNCLTLSEASVL